MTRTPTVTTPSSQPSLNNLDGMSQMELHILEGSKCNRFSDWPPLNCVFLPSLQTSQFLFVNTTKAQLLLILLSVPEIKRTVLDLCLLCCYNQCEFKGYVTGAIVMG